MEKSWDGEREQRNQKKMKAGWGTHCKMVEACAVEESVGNCEAALMAESIVVVAEKMKRKRRELEKSN